jgi:hypothetical protein
MKHLILILMIIFPASFAIAGEGSAPRVFPEIRAVRTSETIKIDGVLDERAWQSAPPITDFVQSDPVQGIAPSQKTEVRLLYDDQALYVGARMYDSAPDSIIAQLTRRDGITTADLFAIALDTYHDKRSGFYFGVSAAGTLLDGTLLNDDWTDDSWDGVWEGKAHIDSKGWTAELRIPYSQLRFHESKNIIWGINFRRDIARGNERDQIVYTPKNESGYVSRFPDFVGIENIVPPRRLDLIPYITTRAEYSHPATGDPFNSGSKYVPATGADLKVGIGSNLTLDGTINPDFGQVEVDPAVVNLSDVETFYQEKRPFFLEGQNIFNFGNGGASNNWSFNWGTPEFFYSRRIGRAPEGSLPAYDFVDEPSGTRILGAAKLSGNVGDNWNIGTIQAVTEKVNAKIQTSGQRSTVEVEPPTYYGIARVQKQFNNGDQAIGLISTLTSRSFSNDNNDLRDQLDSRALSGGVDGWTFLDGNKSWVATGWVGGSRIEGTAAQMLDVQTSSRHYFQRPDAKSYHVDSSATSLSGYSGRFQLVKQKGNFFVNSSFGFISPGFDVNDLGFVWRNDLINYHAGAGYQWVTPTKYYQSIWTMLAVFGSRDFDGNKIWEGIFQRTEIQLRNFYFLSYDVAYNPQTVNNRLTRGGPLALNEPGFQVDASLQTNDKEKWVFGFQGTTYKQKSSSQWDISSNIVWKPADYVYVSFEPDFGKTIDFSQWVGAFADPLAAQTYGSRYVFATLDQTTLAASIRLNWTFTPQLSLQLYLQPLISSGNYHDYKELSRPLSYDFNQYSQGDVQSASEVLKQGSEYVVDPDGNGPAPSFTFDDPNFNFKSLRGNAVLRWEYLPGSVLYFVWTQSGMDDYTYNGEFHFGSSLHRLIRAQFNNIFMVKLTYYLGE